MSEKLPKIENNEKEIAFEHTPENYCDVIFWSFLLSQGNPQIQKVVLDYVVNKVGAFDKEKYEKALELFAEKYFAENELELSEKIRQFHKPIEGEPKTIEREYDWYNTYDTSTPLKTLKYQLSFLDHPPTQEVESVDLRVFANRLWRTDIDYVGKSKYGSEPKGRPGRTEDNEGTGKLKDKWFSFGVYYLMQKNGVPNIPVIDSLLNEARSVSPFKDYSTGKFKTLTFKRLNQFIEEYNLKHTDKMTTMNEVMDYFSGIKIDEDLRKEEEKNRFEY